VHCTISPSCYAPHENEESEGNRAHFLVCSSARSYVLLKKLLLNIWTKFLIKICPKLVLNRDKNFIKIIYKPVLELHNALEVI